jgi:site-specific DNA-methyltransferase (adenine-specific)
VFSHEPECDARCVDGCAVAALDEQTGKRPGGGASGAYVRNNRIYGQDGKQRAAGPTYPDKGTNASTFFYCVKPGRAERELGLGGFRGSGGARNIHPTVKSIDLMRWLIRLITPSGGLVLDTFCGSGSTGMATVLEGCRFIGIELNDTDKEPFVRIALARIAHCADWRPPEQHDAAEPPRQGSLF